MFFHGNPARSTDETTHFVGLGFDSSRQRRSVDARLRLHLRLGHGTGRQHRNLRRICGGGQALVALGRLLGGRSRVAMA
jgi:hypothetical protein